MKKKRVSLFILLFVVFCITAMEKDALQIKQDFLENWESEKEFVNRTKVVTDIYISKEHPFFLRDALYCFSPDETKIAKFEPLNQQELTIFDVNKNRCDKKYKGVFEDQHFRNIALSSCGNNFLTLGTKLHWKEEVFCIDAIIEFHDIVTKKKEILYNAEDNDCFDTIAFNKQGTCCIAHGKKNIFNEDVYKIFPLDIIHRFMSLPVEICNYIYQIFSWNLQKELVEQTSNFPEDLIIKKSQWVSDLYDTTTVRVLSPDQTKAAMITLSNLIGQRPQVTVVQYPEDIKLHKADLTYRIGYETFALAPSGKTVATIYKQERDPHSSFLPYDYHYMLALEKIDSGYMESFDIPYIREPLKVFFNTQGSLCIVYGTEYKVSEQCRCYEIFSLRDKQWGPLIKIEEKKDIKREKKKVEIKNELFDYFEKYLVCKNKENVK